MREVNAGKAYPAPSGTVPRVRFLGAGFPDYPWLFATDGEYTAFASVAAGQFGPIKDHLRALRDVSRVANGDTGKVVHEVVTDGSVYFGANEDEGNTDETVKFPSALALVWRWTGDDRFRDELYDFTVDGMRWAVSELDADGDGWLEGPATWSGRAWAREARRGRLHHPRPAGPRRPRALEARRRHPPLGGGPGGGPARPLRERVVDARGAPARRLSGARTAPRSSSATGSGSRRWRPSCWSTGCRAWAWPGARRASPPSLSGSGPATATTSGSSTPAPPAATAPPAPDERQSFTLNSAIMAVGEGNYGRLGPPTSSVTPVPSVACSCRSRTSSLAPRPRSPPHR